MEGFASTQALQVSSFERKKERAVLEPHIALNVSSLQLCLPPEPRGFEFAALVALLNCGLSETSGVLLFHTGLLQNKVCVGLWSHSLF